MFILIWLLLPELHDYGNENDLGSCSWSSQIQGRLSFSGFHHKCNHRASMLWECLLPCTFPEFTTCSSEMWAIHHGKSNHTLSLGGKQPETASVTEVLSRGPWVSSHTTHLLWTKQIDQNHLQTKGRSPVTQQLHPMATACFDDPVDL